MARHGPEYATAQTICNWVGQANIDAGVAGANGLSSAEREELMRLRRQVRQLQTERDTGPNQMWAYDFVFDACANGQQLKCLTIIDEWTL